MPKYAVLGATGSTGSRIAKILLERDDVHVNLYARSATKLSKIIPGITTAKNATSYTGDLSDQELLTSCLDGVSVIFGTLAQNANQRGVSIAQDQARAIVAGLESLRNAAETHGTEWHTPRVVLLGAGVLTAEGPRKTNFGERLLYHSSFFVYDDLRLAFEYFRDKAPWLKPTIASPAALVDSPPEGFELGPEEQSITLSYDDLAGAMIAMAEDEAWEGQYVSIESKGKPQFGLAAKNMMLYLVPGTFVTTFPPSFRFFRQFGLLP